MANLYSAARATGRKSGSYRASLENIKGFSDRGDLVSKEFSIKSEQLDTAVGKLSDTLSLASMAAGRLDEISSDIDTLEGEYGEIDTGGKDSIFDKMVRKSKMMFGVGEYKFGETSIKAKDFGKESARITYKDMYSEAMSNLNSDKKPSIKSPKDSKKNTDNMEEVINRQREQKAYAEKLQNKSIDQSNKDFIAKNKDKIDFNPYNPDNQSKLESLKQNLNKIEIKPNKDIKTNKPQSSFGEIFKLEREKQGIGGLFEYEGKKYTTNYDWE